MIVTFCLFQSHLKAAQDKTKRLGSDTKMTSKTVQHLLVATSHLAFGHRCKKELCQVFTSVSYKSKRLFYTLMAK